MFDTLNHVSEEEEEEEKWRWQMIGRSQGEEEMRGEVEVAMIEVEEKWEDKSEDKGKRSGELR